MPQSRCNHRVLFIQHISFVYQICLPELYLVYQNCTLFTRPVLCLPDLYFAVFVLHQGSLTYDLCADPNTVWVFYILFVVGLYILTFLTSEQHRQFLLRHRDNVIILLNL